MGRGGWVGLFVLSWLRQFQREIAIQCPAPAPAAGTGLWKEKGKKNVSGYFIGRHLLSREGGFGSISSGVAIFFFLLLFNRAKAGVGVAGGGVGIFGIVSYIHVIWGGLEGFLGGVFSHHEKKILRPICINTALNKIKPFIIYTFLRLGGEKEKKKKKEGNLA